MLECLFMFAKLFDTHFINKQIYYFCFVYAEERPWTTGTFAGIIYALMCKYLKKQLIAGET